MTRRIGLAATADRHRLYELAVQAPQRDVAWLLRWFRRQNGAPPCVLREDFCGSAALAIEFVRGDAERRAIAIDNHRPTFAAAERRAAAELSTAARARLRLHCGDVRAVRGMPADLCVVANFSYCVFHRREELLAYLRSAWRGLSPGGWLVLDVQGGGLTQRPFEERHRHRGFAHVWEQRSFEPISGRIDCRIHFEFADGSSWRDAFVYDWRMWTLPELQDLFAEAGFTSLQVQWQDPRDGEFRRLRRAPASPTWLAFLCGQRPLRASVRRRSRRQTQR